MEKLPHTNYEQDNSSDRSTERGRGHKTMSSLFESGVNAYSHTVNFHPSKIETQATDYIRRYYGELNPNDLTENLKSINSAEDGPDKDYEIACAIFYPDRLKASHSDILSQSDVREILDTGHEIDFASELYQEYGHNFISFAYSGEVGAGKTPEEAKSRHSKWDQDNIFLTLSREKSPLSEVDKDTILQMMEERSEEYTNEDHEDWNKYPLRSFKTESYYADDMRTLAKIFNGASPREALRQDIIKIFKFADGESVLTDKGWDKYTFSEIVGRTMLNINDFSDAVKYMNHKVELIQDLEKRTRYYTIYREAVQSGKEALKRYQ